MRKQFRAVALSMGLSGMLALSGCSGQHRSHAGAAVPTPSGSAGAAFHDGFEQAADNGWKPGINDVTDNRRQETLSQLEAQPGGLLQRVTSPVRDGSYALQATVPHALGSFRSEIARDSVPMGSENWYGFSIYLPPSWQVDSQDTVVAQWHALIGRTKTEGDGVKDNPPVALSVQGNQWMLKLHWNTQGTTADGSGSGSRDYTLGSIRTGVWNDFVLHATWSPGGAGVVQLWQGGRKVVDYTGPDEYNDQQGPYFKIGIYRPGWKSINASEYDADTSTTGPLTLYDDDVRIAQGPARYGDVAA